MISEKTGRKLDKTFDSLKVEVKNKVYQEVKDLGLKIEFGTESWSAYMRRRTKMTQGKLSKLYKLFAEFEQDDVDVFLDAFSSFDELLNAKKNATVALLKGVKDD
jgi:hypothetical protein